jgi:hypothetical protein
MTEKTEIDETVEKIISIRKRPLLILYWHDCEGCEIENNHYMLVYRELRKYVKSIEEIDVLLHTAGGTIDGSFALARAIREVANKVNFLLLYMAWSGGISIGVRQRFV